MRMRRSRRVSPTGSIILVMLIISVFAIGTGYIVSRFLISSFVKQPSQDNPPGSVAVQPPATKADPTNTGNTAANPAQPQDTGGSVPAATTPKVTPTVPTIPFVQVQLGAFAQEANAQNLAKSVQAQGMPATVMPRNLYQVVVGVFTDRNLAEAYIKSVEAKGQKEVHLSSATIAVTQAKSFQGGEGELVKSLASLLEDARSVTTKSLALADQLYAKSGDQAAWRKQVSDLGDQVARLEQIQLPNSQGSPIAQEWSGWLKEMKTHLTNNATRSLTDAAAWQAAQTELMRAIARLQALYSLLGS